jgi:hypothetical protein
VKKLTGYIAKHGYKTAVMPCTWRHSRGTGERKYEFDQIEQLVGVDRMALRSRYLQPLAFAEAPLPRALDAASEAAACGDEDKRVPWMKLQIAFTDDVLMNDRVTCGVAHYMGAQELLRDSLFEELGYEGLEKRQPQENKY